MRTPHADDTDSILDRVSQHAHRTPQRRAYLHVDTTAAVRPSWTYAELAATIQRLAPELRTRVGAGGTVLLWRMTAPWFPAAVLAAWHAGLDVAAVDADAPPAALERMGGRLRTVWLLTHADLEDVALPGGLTPLRPEELLAAKGDVNHADENGLAPTSGGRLFLESSGSTGPPKLVARDLPSLDVVAADTAEALRLSGQSVMLSVASMTHSYGLEHGVLAPLWAGATVVTVPGLHLPAIVAGLGEGVTHMAAVPALYERLCDFSGEVALEGMNCAYAAGAPFPPALSQRVWERWGVHVGQLYGATEIGSVTLQHPTDEPFDPQSVGRPFRRTSIRIVDPDTRAPLPTGQTGEVAVRSGSMMAGYHDAPTPWHNGFFLTGDLGRLDEHGRLFITGRLKLLIDVGGLKVNPLEVEAVLLEHPGVRQCVVVGVRQSDTVERLKAIVVIDDGAAVTDESLRAWARQHLAAHKVPRMFEQRDALPCSSTGKVLRHLL